jgi:RND family efflux transporter MFP subunit
MSTVNLRELAIERTERQPRPSRKRRRAWFSRYIVPGVVLLGFVALLGWAMWDRLITRRQVSVVPVVLTRSEVQQAGTPLFQAAGWIEPRPTAANVAALTEGVIEELLVVEGQPVEVGQPVAKLIDVDASLALQEAEIQLVLRESELRSAAAELKAAKLRKEFPVHLEAQLAEAESILAKTRTELAQLPFLIQSAETQLEYAQNNLEGKRSAGAGISGRSLQLAESELGTTAANLNELKQREPSLRREEAALQKKQDALASQLKLLIDESRQVESAIAQEEAAKANRDRAQLMVEKARLNLERCIVRSPMTGRVMQLVAQPGIRVMGLESNASRSSSTVVTLYDPRMLQVRADVRLEDVPLVEPGQPVEVQTASSKETLHGVVLRPTSSANIQKNTLEVKVSLTDPPETIRPEMLVTATFLAPPKPEAAETSKEQERLLVPRELVDLSAGAATVWIVDASGQARRRSIQMGKAGSDKLVEVTSGLTPTDKLIASGVDGLQDGELVEISREDERIGM